MTVVSRARYKYTSSLIYLLTVSTRHSSPRQGGNSCRIYAYPCPIRFLALRNLNQALDPLCLVLLPERDYVTFGSLLSKIRLSFVVCLSVTLVYPTQTVEAFGKISSPLCTLAIF